MNKERLLTTTEFAQAIGMSESSIRRLADGGDLKIHKTKGGHRKIPLEEAIRYARDQDIKILRPELLGIDSIDLSAEPNASLLHAFRAGDGDLTTRLLQSLYFEGRSIAQICDGPIKYAMQEIGGIWPADRRAIFLEHRATIICMRALSQIRMSMPTPKSNQLKSLGAAPGGDPFILPSMMASLVLYDAGFNDINLGPDTPVEVLIDALEDERPNIAWLSLSTPIVSRFQANEIERMRIAAQQQNCLFVLGGRYASSIELSDTLTIENLQGLEKLAKQIATAN